MSRKENEQYNSLLANILFVVEWWEVKQGRHLKKTNFIRVLDNAQRNKYNADRKHY
jgi:hypothetical protein